MINNKENKILQFEYIIHRMIEWYKDIAPNTDSRIPFQFTRVASLKLLFLVSAVKDTRNNNHDLLDTFNNYRAMQYGPVEVDVYSAMALRKTKFYTFRNYKMEISSGNPDFSGLSEGIKNEIDRAIEVLRGHNSDIVKLPASQLIDITHKWKSWQIARSLGVILGEGNDDMPVETIRSDRQFYE